MKIPLLCLLFAVLFGNTVNAQSDKFYEKKWKEIDSLIGKSLPQSALELVKEVYAKASAEKNNPHMVKAVIYRISLMSDYQEDYYENSISELKKEVQVADQQVKPLLWAMLGELYWNYYTVNRWKFYQRTPTDQFDNEDIKTWTLSRLVQEVKFCYDQALADPASLSKISLGNWSPVLHYADYVSYSPTMLDFIGWMAITRFMNEETALTKPANAFVMNDAAYFYPGKSFARMSIPNDDTTSFVWYAAHVFQTLTLAHVNDADQDVFTFVELQRLAWVKSKSSLSNRDSLYEKALNELHAASTGSKSFAETGYALATWYRMQAGKYNYQSAPEYQWFNKKALDIADQVIKKWPDSRGASNCLSLKEEITRPYMTLALEKASSVSASFEGILSYSNSSKAWFRILKLDPDKNRSLDRKMSYEEIIQYYSKQVAVKEFQIDLVNPGDHQNHTTNVVFDGLEPGFYIVLHSNSGSFDMAQGWVGYTPFWSTSVSFLMQNKDNEEYVFLVTDRETGQPLQGAQVDILSEKYNYVTREYVYSKYKSLSTDANGKATLGALPKGSDYRYMYADVKYKDQRFCSYETFYMYPPYDHSSGSRTISYFFTDRSLYRPGQTVYFKGILLTADADNNYSIQAGKPTTVTFYDANYQVVATQSLTSNEFGTFTGSFIAPDNGLTGQMRITNGYGNSYISVEEYKRPKFYVQFEPVKGSYRLGEQVTVTGKALAYAGNNIDGASVKYRVVRNARFPYWWSWWYMPAPYSAQTEIANGTATTDADGRFTVTFNAIPDANIRKDFQPVFNYTIYADVTDLNGETRSSSTWVGAGYKSLVLGSTISQEVLAGQYGSYEISSQNLSGQTVPSEVTLLLYALKSPDRIINSRLLSKPEFRSLDEADYLARFPYSEFDNESNPSEWERTAVVFSKLYQTKTDSIIPLDSIMRGRQGAFMLVLSAKDAYGEPVEYQQFFRYYVPAVKSACSNQAFYMKGIETSCEPGETARVLLGSYAENVKVLVETEHKGKIVASQWIQLSREQKILEWPVAEEHRGNFTIHFATVKEGRFYHEDVQIYVPYTNKELDIEIESFRDKLQPGEGEKWKMTIRNASGGKEMAELLAGMYDASLDAYKSHSWYMNLLNYYYGYRSWDDAGNFSTSASSQYSTAYTKQFGVINIYLPKLNWFRYPIYNYYGYYDDYDGDEGGVVLMAAQTSSAVSGRSVVRESSKKGAGDYKDAPSTMDVLVEESEVSAGEKNLEDNRSNNGLILKEDKNGQQGNDMGDIAVRTNFNETAFFFPQLRTNENGDVVVEFTMPESLTKWKFMGLAHTKDLKTGTITKNLVTQKTLMVNSFAPRFLREGDRIVFTSKISNLSENDLDGVAMLELINPLTGESVNDLYGLTKTQVSFSTKKGQSTKVSWTLQIPFGSGAVTYRIKARAGAYTDGEEMTLPVLSNRMLVIETLPLPIRGNESKTWTFEKFVNSGSSKTLKSHRYTLEFTSNPAWYAVQALPYVIEYPYECTEQTFSRYYANAIATFIANSSPKIQAVFDSWKNLTPESFMSNLEKNEELKSLVLEETPWVLDAKDESDRKKRIALLFDINRMAKEKARTEKLLSKLQSPNGGFPWYKGMPDDQYITQLIVTGFGKLDHLGIREVKNNGTVGNMVQKAVYYLDDRIREDYEYIKKHWTDYKSHQHIGYLQVHYLYSRSFFPDWAIEQRNKEAYEYFFSQAKTYWTSFSPYARGLISLALFRSGEKTVSADIVKSLRETSLHSDEMGMYWREFVGGYYWYEAPIESQALMVEVFDEVAADPKAVEELKIWLLKQKQVQDWKTTRATVDAIYALLLRGFNLLESEELVEVKIGGKVIDPYTIEGCKVEAGTGYFKTAWTADEINPDMGKIAVTKKDSGIAWGAVYWQYFEDLDKITPAETPLSIKKQLFVERNSATGIRMEPVNDNGNLKVGDKVKVRIEIRVDRDMEYVHMKDMRGSCMEPVNVLSTTKYQGGLWYFENTRDAATNFFFNYLYKGTYVFEYVMNVTHAGEFSNGITTIQCMYAPEFTSHSEGIRVIVSE